MIMQTKSNPNLLSKVTARSATIHVARVFGASLYKVSGFPNTVAEQPG